MTQAMRLLTATAVAGLFSLTAGMPGESVAASTQCIGGAQEFVNGFTNNSPVIIGGSTVLLLSTIPGGASGAAGDTDLYTMTLSIESFNNTTSGLWLAQAQVSVNGGLFSNIDPVGPNTMHIGPTRHTNTMTWCKRIAASTSATFRIVVTHLGPAGSSTILDNYLTRVERSN